MASQKASIAHFLNKVAPKYVRDHVFYFNIQQLHLTLTLTQSFPTWATLLGIRHRGTREMRYEGKVWSINLFYIAELQTVPLHCA